MTLEELYIHLLQGYSLRIFGDKRLPFHRVAGYHSFVTVHGDGVGTIIHPSSNFFDCFYNVLHVELKEPDDC